VVTHETFKEGDGYVFISKRSEDDWKVWFIAFVLSVIMVVALISFPGIINEKYVDGVVAVSIVFALISLLASIFGRYSGVYPGRIFGRVYLDKNWVIFTKPGNSRGVLAIEERFGLSELMKVEIIGGRWQSVRFRFSGDRHCDLSLKKPQKFERYFDASLAALGIPHTKKDKIFPPLDKDYYFNSAK